MAHLDGHLVHAPPDEVAHGFHHAALRLDPHRRLLETAALPQVLREDAKPVAGLLGLAPVRVEDAEPDVGNARAGPEQDPVRADAPVAMADPANRRRPERKSDVALLHDEVVIAKPVSLGEPCHGACPRLSWPGTAAALGMPGAPACRKSPRAARPPA